MTRPWDLKHLKHLRTHLKDPQDHKDPKDLFSCVIIPACCQVPKPTDASA